MDDGSNKQKKADPRLVFPFLKEHLLGGESCPFCGKSDGCISYCNSICFYCSRCGVFWTHSNGQTGMTEEDMKEVLAFLDGYVHISIGEPVKLLDVDEEEMDSISEDDDDFIPF